MPVAAAEPLDLAAVVAEAEASNPQIQAARARRDASAHVPSQAEARPDPLAGVSYTNETLTGFTLGSREDANLTLSWTQEVPYPGKRALAGDVARTEIDRNDIEIDVLRLRVVARVKELYAELYRIDRTTEILRDSRKLLDSLLDAARARYEGGEGILENILKAQTERTRLDADLADLAQQRRSAASALGAVLGRESDGPFGPAVVLPETLALDLPSLERAAVDGSPEILALRAASRTVEARRSLAEKNLKPDFVWSAAYAHRGGLDPMVMGSLGIRLPLYRRAKQAEAVVQAEHELEASRRDVTAREVAVRAEVRDLAARAERAETLMRLYRDGALPQARGALDAAGAAYGVGRAEFLTLIEDFRTVLEYEIEYERQAADRLMALAALEPLTGTILVLPGGDGRAAALPGGSHE